MLNFLRPETVGSRTQLVFTGKEMKIYIPSNFFNDDTKDVIAEVLGTYVSTIGIIYLKVDGNDKKLILPTKIMFQFSDSDIVKNFKVNPESAADDYNVYTLNNGDIFIYDTLHRQDVSEPQLFIMKFIEGMKLPKFITYEESLTAILKMIDICKANLGVPLISFEFILAELYRYKRNMNEPFRFHYTGKNGQDAKGVRITKVTSLMSTWASITGEDVNSQLISSIIRTRKGMPERESPVEELAIY